MARPFRVKRGHEHATNCAVDELHPDRLREELERRKANDPTFSLRKFAVELGLSKSALSAYLLGQRGMLPSTARRVAEKLGVPSERVQAISKTLHRKRKWDRASAYREISGELMRVLDDEVCLAILSLARIENHSDPRWIAQRLGTPLPRIQAALELLDRLELVRTEAGRLVRSSSLLSYPTQTPSEQVRTFHRSVLDRAARSLTAETHEQREFAAAVMPVDPRFLPEAKRMLHRFKRRLTNTVNRGKPREVYMLSLQLFPLSDAQVKT